MPFGPTYDIINTLARWSLNSYFKAIVISNPQEVPPTGPVIVAGNHWNMTIDPAMLSSRMPHGRRLHYWAKNTLFKNPIINFILLDAGNIPVDRTTRNNQLLFKGTFDVLKLGECVALFPEGTSYTQPKIIQVKDGIAWTALEYAKNLRLTGQELSGSAGTANGLRTAPGEVEDVKVIVCGLNYTDKTRYRAAVQVEYSAAITLDQATVDRFMTVGEEKAAVKELIRSIEARLRAVTVNADDWETLWSARILREFIWADGLGPLHHYRDNMQQLVNIMSLKEDSPPSIRNLRTDLIEYHHQLAAVNTSHQVFAQVFPSREARARLLVEAGRCLFIWPFFLMFAAAHIPAYLGAYLGSRLQPNEPESMDQNKVVLGLFSGLAAVPIYVVIIARMLLAQQEERDWMRMMVATIIGLGAVIVVHVVHDGMVDGAYGAWKRLRTCWRLKEDRLDELWDLRERCLEGWAALENDLRSAHHPGFLKLLALDSLASRIHSPLTPANSSGLIADPPSDLDPLLDSSVDEKSLLRGKKTL
ncbi:hypothetical protein PTTG_09732 [Puccinia triticina 1-1 BBBD Race 1]|uniref:PlsC domain-containing protein n=2 Tax=Puccinia triticina TaxID=208348 RepID=A0A180G3I8_PUCT1|nr:uncharacterized protein PtA15_11A352 [Puccinia triticina]OAV87170.1 hypothetical protein PTTG_09732 [Puccinia triticina 1-1 BBBD Race 1]WAQ89662.1 hypothetical protein PtA15_11A352 [Puccinia triticina]WAR59695.1 hypothetical protein PtB15_11B335 [Puccinia triticina]